MNQKNDNSQIESTHWSLLWSCFEQITEAPKAKQSALIKALNNKHPELFPEIALLLQSHQTETSILDKELIGVDAFNSFKPPKYIGGFEILERLGSGGLGDVYKACKQEDGFEHVVAVKMAPAGQYSTVVLDSFNNELNMLLSLNHPHIERLFEGGVTDQGIPYLVVEYIKGQHIDEYCDNNRLNVRQRIGMFLQVCDAVATMHQSLIIHRDIKARNIMVSGNGTSKLLDFGLAKLIETQASQHIKEQTFSGFMMTLAYASPEQIRGQNITTSSDVYSLGMLLYYLLSGRLPYSFENNDLMAISKQFNEMKSPLASQNIKQDAPINQIQASLKNKIKGDLDAIMAKSISLEPERRYSSAQQLADDLNRFLSQQPVLAKPDAVSYRISKFIQRHTLGFVITSAVVLSLLLLSLMLFNRSNALHKSLQATLDEKQRVDQVTEFLVDVFKYSDPLQNQADIVNVKDLLDHSSQQLKNQFIQEPATKAKLYQTLASVYSSMSDIEKAEDMLNSAKQINPVSSMENDFINTMLEAELLQKQGHLNAALTSVKTFEQNNHKAELPLVMSLKKSLIKGQLLYQLGTLEVATEVLQQANQKLLKHDVVNHPIKTEQIQADIHQLLGNIFWKKGDLQLVEKYYQKSFDSNLSRLGQAHHATLKSLSALGVLAYSQGHYEVAKSRFERVLSIRVNQLGQNHFLTADAHNRLGATEYELGHLMVAQNHYNQALKAFESIGLRESIKFTRVLNNLGLIKRQQIQYLEAEQLFHQALAIQTQLLGEQHPDLATMLNNLGLTAYDQGHFNQALDWFKQAYQVQLDATGLNNVNIAFAMTNIGRMYLLMNQSDQAEHWISQAMHIRSQQLGPEHLLFAATLMVQAELAYSLKNFDMAANSAEQALNIRKNHLEQGDWRLSESRHFLLSLTSGSTENHQQLCDDAENIESRFGSFHPSLVAIFKRMDEIQVKCHF